MSAGRTTADVSPTRARSELLGRRDRQGHRPGLRRDRFVRRTSLQRRRASQSGRRAQQQAPSTAPACRPRSPSTRTTRTATSWSAECGGGLAFGFSSDGGTSYDISLEYPNGSGSSITSLYDVAIAGGTAIAVGDSGVILDLARRAEGVLPARRRREATSGWRAVDKFDANNAAVVGAGGKIVISTQASTIPDLIAPAGTISGPVTATAGQPVDLHRERRRQRRRLGHRPGRIPVDRHRCSRRRPATRCRSRSRAPASTRSGWRSRTSPATPPRRRCRST